MKNYTTIDAKALEATLHRMRDALLNGNPLAFEIQAKDGAIKNLILRAGAESIQLDAGYSTFSVAEAERPIRWFAKVELIGDAKKLLEAQKVKTCLVFHFEQPGLDEHEVRKLAIKRTKEYLTELERRYEPFVLGGNLQNDYNDITCERFKLIGMEKVAVNADGKPKATQPTPDEMPF